MIEIQDFSFKYNNCESTILNHLNITIKPGEFILVLGSSGSGKSTLLRALNGLIPHFFGGIYEGEIIINGKNPGIIPPHKLAKEVGFLFQNPENQILMDKVYSELIFGLENLEIPRNEIISRLEDAVSVYNLEPLMDKITFTLSGGQKQLVALASVLSMQPKVLLLDEPTSELDPFAREKFLKFLVEQQKLHNFTIIMVEHNIENIISYATRIIYLNRGKIAFDGFPEEFFRLFFQNPSIPKPPVLELVHRIRQIERFNLIDLDKEDQFLPLSAQDFASQYKNLKHLTPLLKFIEKTSIDSVNSCLENSKSTPILEIKNLAFAYDPDNLVLSDISFSCMEGDVICLMGRNGCGKTTLLKNIAGILHPNNGKISMGPKNAYEEKQKTNYYPIGFVFQNPTMQFYRDTVFEELDARVHKSIKNKRKRDEKIKHILEFFHLSQYIRQYPRFLSLGEQQRLALACALINEPSILLLDEPTHGMDFEQKNRLIHYIQKIQKEKCTVIIATHEISLVTSLKSRVLYMDENTIKWKGLPREILPERTPFKTQINIAMNLIFEKQTPFLTVQDVMEAIEN